MDERQKDFLQALIDCGISMNMLIAVGIMIKTESSRMLMTKKILEAEKRGEEITDGLVGTILVDLMKLASKDSAEQPKEHS